MYDYETNYEMISPERLAELEYFLTPGEMRILLAKKKDLVMADELRNKCRNVIVSLMAAATEPNFELTEDQRKCKEEFDLRALDRAEAVLDLLDDMPTLTPQFNLNEEK